MTTEDLVLEVDIQRMEYDLQHRTVQGAFEQLHTTIEEFIDVFKNSIPSVL